MSTSGLSDLIARERWRAAEMFSSLDEGQWSKWSLCEGWRVRDVAAHMVLPFVVPKRKMMAGMLANRGDFDRWSAKASHALAARPTPELVATLRANAAHPFTPSMFGPEAPLADACIHTRDAARPLGLTASAPVATWRFVLDFLTEPKGRRSFVPEARLRGLRLVATDQRWSYGRGDEVAGRSEALALAAAGRPAALDELRGDGVDTLRRRVF
jgi:uncharacterized protein (TIGR03083 family)